jgi:hypothetical protein
MLKKLTLTLDDFVRMRLMQEILLNVINMLKFQLSVTNQCLCAP